MKKILVPGIVAGILLIIVGMGFGYVFGMIFPQVEAEYQNTELFRPWADPLMSLMFVSIFLIGIVLSWLWDNVSKSLKGKGNQKALQFGIMWLLLMIPGMIITYASFQISLLMITNWTIMAFLNGLVSGFVFVKMKK